MKRTFFQITALLSLIVIGYSACQKEKDSNDSSVAESIISVEDNALADETFTDIFTDLAGLGLDDNGPFSSMTNSGSNKISTVPTNDHEHQMGCADL